MTVLICLYFDINWHILDRSSPSNDFPPTETVSMISAHVFISQYGIFLLVVCCSCCSVEIKDVICVSGYLIRYCLICFRKSFNFVVHFHSYLLNFESWCSWKGISIA